ncbi:MAG: winged helix-turn-helix transcriptional regulator [Sphingomonadaceae bacterium]|nr:winged helix-turn-helix transcriptional regulator [Sphingomonadaceae bacterium]
MTAALPSQAVFDAIADPVRRDILAALTERPAGVEEIAARFPISRPAVSRHLKLLLRAGLVARRESGRNNIYRIETAPLEAVRTWMNDIWQGRLALLKRIAEGDS